MTVIANPCKDVHGSNRNSLIGLALNDTQTQMLLSITRRHCKLGVEHGRADTTPERRQQIHEKIQCLRSMRDDLIAEWRAVQKNELES